MTTTESRLDRRTILKGAAGVGALGMSGVVGGAAANRPPQSPGGANPRCDHTVKAGESIQDAIDAADDGETICIEAGTYEESLNITRANGLTIRGAGSDAVTIDASGEPGYGVDGVFATDEWGSDVTLEGFTLIGPQAGTESQNFGLKLSYIDGLVVEDVRVTESRRTGIDVFPATDVAIRDSASVDNGANGIAIRSASDVVIKDVATANNSWGGIALYAPGDETVSDVTVQNCSFVDQPAGVYLDHDGYEDIDILDSTFKIPDSVPGEWLHIMFEGGATGRIEGNDLSGGHRVGILARGDGTDVTIRDNSIIGTGPKTSGWAENGIQIDQGASATVQRNTVVGHWWDDTDWSSTGILALSDNVTIQRNEVVGNDAGIWLSHDRCHVVRNDIVVEADGDFPGSDGVVVQGDRNRLVNNDITGDSDAFGGILVWGASGTKLINNRIDGFQAEIERIDDEDTILPPPFDPAG